MPIIDSIPKTYIEGCLKLIRMNEAVFEKLFSLIKGAEYMLGLRRLAKTISNKTELISNSDIEAVLLFVGSLIPLKEQQNVSFDAIIDEIIQAIKNENNKELTFESVNAETFFRRKLNAFLNNKQIYYTVMVAQFYSEHENLLRSANITVDLRPIFIKNSKELPQVGITSAVLHINYQNAGKIKEVEIALDDDDIKSLKVSIEEAENQIRLLSSICEKIGMVKIKTNEKK